MPKFKSSNLRIFMIVLSAVSILLQIINLAVFNWDGIFLTLSFIMAIFSSAAMIVLILLVSMNKFPASYTALTWLPLFVSSLCCIISGIFGIGAELFAAYGMLIPGNFGYFIGRILYAVPSLFSLLAAAFLAVWTYKKDLVETFAKKLHPMIGKYTQYAKYLAPALFVIRFLLYMIIFFSSWISGSFSSDFLIYLFFCAFASLLLAAASYFFGEWMALQTTEAEVFSMPIGGFDIPSPVSISVEPPLEVNHPPIFESHTIYCKHCGTELNSEWNACPICSSPIHETCKNCGYVFEKTTAFCPECGTKRNHEEEM